jgi:hypothetical protein
MAGTSPAMTLTPLVPKSARLSRHRRNGAAAQSCGRAPEFVLVRLSPEARNERDPKARGDSGGPAPIDNWSSSDSPIKALCRGKRTHWAVARPVDGMGEVTERIPARGFAALCRRQMEGSTSSPDVCMFSRLWAPVQLRSHLFWASRLGILTAGRSVVQQMTGRRVRCRTISFSGSTRTLPSRP